MNISKSIIMGKWNLLNFWAKEKKKKEVRYILSLDGGGMRGIIPSYILSRIEDDLKRTFNDKRPLYSHFDLIAGTSTGALIAIAMAAPVTGYYFEEKNGHYPVYDKITRGKLIKKESVVFRGEIEELASAKEILDLYLEHGSEIFKSPKGLKNLFGPIFNDRYDGNAFDSFLLKILSQTKLSECKVPTIAVSFDTNTSSPYIFSSEDSHGILAWEATRASSAAPTYFPPVVLIDRENGNNLNLIDGGVAANNPSLLAYKEARKLYPDADEFRILSLSTCAPKHSIDVENASSGAVGWANPLFKAYSEAQLAVADIVAQSIKDVFYTRIWAPVLGKKIKLDDYSQGSIDTLMDAAEKTYTECKKEIDAFVKEIAMEETHECVKLVNKPELIEDRRDL